MAPHPQFYIETERLILRDLKPTDDEGMFELDSDAEVHKYVGRKPVKTIDESRAVIEMIRDQYIRNGIGRWALIEKSTGNFIGWGGLKYTTEPIDGRIHYYDLGYRLIRKYWGKGFATEQALAAVQYAWNVLMQQELYGMAHIDNAASRRVLEKAGMHSFGKVFDYDGNDYVWYKMQAPQGLDKRSS